MKDRSASIFRVEQSKKRWFAKTPRPLKLSVNIFASRHGITSQKA